MGIGPVMLDVVGTQLTAEDEARLRHPLVGGVILFKRNYESPGQLMELTAAIHALRTPPLLIAVDHEVVNRVRLHLFSPALKKCKVSGNVADVMCIVNLRLCKQCACGN